MKVSQVSATNYASKKSNPSQSNPSFLGHWSINGQRILEGGDHHLRIYAEHFHKCPPKIIKEISTIRGFFFIKEKKKSQQAYDRISQAIEKVRADKERWQNRIKALENLILRTNKEEQELNKLKLAVKDLDKKADNYVKVYFTEENTKSYSTGYDDRISPSEDPVFLQNIKS